MSSERLRRVGLAASLILLPLAFVRCVGDDPTSPTTTGSPDGATDTSIDSGNSGSDANTEAGPNALLTDAIEVAAGGTHTCAIRSSGAVVCWGKNDHGQLGVPTSAASTSSTPVTVAGLDPAAHIAAGTNHTCVVTKTNRAFCWGDDTDGESGLLPLGASSSGVHEVLGADDAGVDAGLVAIAAGGRVSCALTPPINAAAAPGGGDLYCWGTNDNFQLGVGQSPFKSASPVQVLVPGPSAPQAAIANNVAIGLNFGCAALYEPVGINLGLLEGCWGENDRGQLAVDAGASQTAATIVKLGGSVIANVDLLAAGAKHACARAASATVVCWGDDSSGQIGTLSGGATLTNNPVQLTGLNAANLTAMAAGGNETCAIESQVVKCIGDNTSGQQGSGVPDKNVHATFTAPTLDPRATALSVGDSHVCAILGDPGTVMCWGSNAAGQLGDALDLSVGYTDSPSNPDLKFARGNPVAVVAPH